MNSLHKYLQINDPVRRFLFALKNRYLLGLALVDDEILNLRIQFYGIDFSTFQIGPFYGVIEWKSNDVHKSIHKGISIRDFINLLDKVSLMTVNNCSIDANIGIGK